MANRNCGVRIVLDEMSDEDRDAFLALLAAPIAAAAVSRELESAKKQISYQTIYRHRVGNCSCEVSK